MKPLVFSSYPIYMLMAFCAALNASADTLRQDMALDGDIKEMFLNKNKEELLRSYPSQAKLAQIPTEGETVSAIKFSLYGSELALYLENSVVTKIEARDPVFRTESGLRVGVPLKTVLAKHKNGQFFFGFEEGGYISYLIQDGKVAFMVNHSSIPYARFLDKAVHIEDADVLNSNIESIWVRK